MYTLALTAPEVRVCPPLSVVSTDLCVSFCGRCVFPVWRTGRPAALCGAGDRDTLSSTGHGGGVYSRGGCFVAFAPTAALTSTSSLRRGIYNLRSSSRRGAASTNGGIAMTSQVQPEPVGNNNAGDGSSNVVYTSAMTMKKLNGRTFYRRTLKPPCIAFR